MNPIQSNYSLSSLSSALMTGTSTINNIRLTQALYGKNTTAISPVKPIQKTLSSDASVFLKDYQGKMTDMLTKAGEVLGTKAGNKLAAGSSDAKVAAVSGSMGNTGDRFDLVVEQLASGQVNRSQGVESAGTLPSMGGRLVIQTDKGKTELYLSAAGAKTNKEALVNFAGKINAANTGVTAAVVDKDGKSYLELTGGDKDFSVSGSLGERLGLDQAAAQRQDAVYTVAKNGGEAKRVTSATNNVTVEGLVTAKLGAVGKTSITAGQSAAEQKADAMETLVKSFNDTLKFLNQNADRGTGVLNQIKRMIMPPTSEKSMEKIGITIGKDGSMSFDRAKYAEATAKDPTLTKSVTDSFARGIQTDAQMGMKETSQNLVGGTGVNSLAGGKLSSLNYDTASISFMNAYSRNGVFNTMNLYAVGALMNISV